MPKNFESIQRCAKVTELYKDDMILDFCKNKRVLHIGACDSPYHIGRGKRGELLHQKLQEVCNELIGIDIDRKAIKTLNDLGINNIYYGNIIKNEYGIDLNNCTKFDLILFGDVIEHLENPGIALDNIKELMNDDAKLILTAPNAFSYAVIKTWVTGKENVPPDHVFWTSIKTLTKLFERKDLKIEYFTYCLYKSFQKSKSLNKLGYKLIFRKKRHLMPCLFFVLSKI